MSQFIGQAASLLGGANNGGGNALVSTLESIIGNQSNFKPAEDHEIQEAKDDYTNVVENNNQKDTPNVVGNAAAVTALAQFAGLGSSGSSGGGINDMIRMAITAAMKLFSGQGEGGQNQAIQQAAKMAIKLFLSKQAVGGVSSGGVGGLLSSFLGSSTKSNPQQQQQASSGLDIGSIVGSLLGGSQQQGAGSNIGSVASGIASKFL